MNKHSENDPIPVVSVDSHIGPRLIADLRPYCPSKYVDEFDAFARRLEDVQRLADERVHGKVKVNRPSPNFLTAGHYDSAARLADFDYDGVAAAVMFHGSANREPIPFVGSLFIPGMEVADRELVAVGHDIYNRWLVDFVSQSPHRHIGLAYPTLWDVDEAVRQVEWAHDNGLKGINLPGMRTGELPEYNKDLWEPLWSVCEERGMPLVTHVGGGVTADYTGAETLALLQMETGGWLSRRAIWWLIFGGVFERHPGLKLVLTETPGNWMGATADELDGIYGMFTKQPEYNRPFLEKVPRPPSEYIANNVFVGASFASRHEAEQAVLNGLESQFMWGSDYPHPEGTFVYPNGSDMPSVTRLALRNTFCEVPVDSAKRMVGENAMRVYNLDAAALQTIAREIDALTPTQLATPIDAVPEAGSTQAFRSGTAAWS